MSTLPREAFYVSLGFSTYAAVALDTGHYTATLAPKLGFVKVAPIAPQTTINADIGCLKKTGRVAEIKLNCTNGVGDNKRRRAVKVLCDLAMIGSAVVNAKGEIVLLGNGSSPASWVVDSVSV